VSASALDFGALLTGAASNTQTLTVSNGGQAPLSFSAISLSGAQAAYFTLGGTCSTQAQLAAGASCTVTLLAQPTTAGAFSASLNLASNASNGNVAVGLSGSASAAAPALAANPSALAFGSQTVGAPAATQTLTLNNTGNVALTLSSIAVSGASSVTVGSGGSCGASLAVGASCTVALSFAPTAQGNVAATLLVRSNAADLQVAVSGSGTTATSARPTLSNGGPLAFADTQVGQASAIQRITLSNEGSAALKIGSLVLGGSHAGDFTLGGSCAVNATLGASASCTLEPAFKPTAAGARSADLVLVTDGGAQFSVRLAGNGVAVAGTAALSMNPSSFDFEGITVGANASKRFVLTNSGNAPLNLGSASASGPYTVLTDASSCPALPFTLQPGASCELPVRFAPSVAGTASGSVVLQALDASASWTIPLSGQGNAAAPVAQATQNQGGGGCSAARDGRDPTLAGLVLLAAAVLLWRRRQARAIAAAAALVLSAQAGALEVGKQAPAFALDGPAGSVNLEQYAGKLVYVDFWASWCGPCRQSFPWMNEMQAKYGPRGFQVVGISVDAKVEDARSFLAGTPAHFIVAFDPAGATPRSYGIKGMPSSVLVGPDGKVVYQHSGFRPADKAELERRIQLALGGKP
jgi:MYXO-CTERM domain-containing protein